MSEEVKENQNKSVPGKNGGARPGAGRPKGRQNLMTRDLRALLKEVITEEDVQRLFQEWYDSGDYKKQLSVIEYVYGKPNQSLTVDGKVDIEFAKLMKDLHDIGGKDTKGPTDNKEPVSQ